MGINIKNIAFIPHNKDKKITTVISGSSIEISGWTIKHGVKHFNFEVLTPTIIKKERNSAYKYFSID